MALFQGVNPQSLEGARMSLLQRLQAQMGARQQNQQKMRGLQAQQPGGGMGNGGAAVGRPLGLGQLRGSIGRLGITQGSNVASGVFGRLGATNPRALPGEFSSAPGEGLQGHPQGNIIQPGGFMQPGTPAMAPSPGYGGVNTPGMGGAPSAPSGAPGVTSQPNMSLDDLNRQLAAQGLPPQSYPTNIGPGNQTGQTNSQLPTGQQIAGLPGDAPVISSNMIPLGDGRFFDPDTGAIHLGGSAPGFGSYVTR